MTPILAVEHRARVSKYGNRAGSERRTSSPLPAPELRVFRIPSDVQCAVQELVQLAWRYEPPRRGRRRTLCERRQRADDAGSETPHSMLALHKDVDGDKAYPTTMSFVVFLTRFRFFIDGETARFLVSAFDFSSLEGICENAEAKRWSGR